jgi:hypothetical protein
VTGATGTFSYCYSAKTSGYAIVSGDNGCLIDATSGTFNDTLPSAVTVGNGFGVTLKNSGTGVVTILTTSSQTIDTVNSGRYWLAKGEAITVQSDGANWKVISFVESQWIDYSATATIVGWSSFLGKTYLYKKSFRGLSVNVYFYGTSNSTSTTFSLPISVNAATVQPTGFTQDNGIVQNTGYAIPSSTTVVAIYKTATSGTWTASGSKWAVGYFNFIP